jgi:hypothetical protein
MKNFANYDVKTQLFRIYEFDHADFPRMVIGAIELEPVPLFFFFFFFFGPYSDHIVLSFHLSTFATVSHFRLSLDLWSPHSRQIHFLFRSYL